MASISSTIFFVVKNPDPLEEIMSDKSKSFESIALKVVGVACHLVHVYNSFSAN